MYFAVLSILGLFITYVVTKGGVINHNGKWWFDKLILAPSQILK